MSFLFGTIWNALTTSSLLLSVLLFSTAHTYSSRLPGADCYMMALTEREKMLRGELYCAFTPDLIAARTRCKWACNRFNRTDEAPRRQLVELWKE